MDNVEQLIKDNKKLIELEITRYATNIPRITVQLEAYRLAREAAKSYNSSLGFKFSTHLMNSLKKLSRMSTQYGGVLRVPENTQFGISKLQKVEKDLEHTLGRPPTLEELAHHTNTGIKTVSNILNNRKVSSGISSLFEAPELLDGSNAEWVHFVYHDLSDKDKLIFEHMTGYGGKKILPNNEIASKLNLSIGTLNNRIKLITTTLSKGWK